MDRGRSSRVNRREVAAPLLASVVLLASLFPAGHCGASAEAQSSPMAENVYDQIDILDQWYRYLDSPGHREAEAHILSVLDGYGLNTSVQEYTAQRVDGTVRAANVLGMLEGSDPTRCLVIGGHYDNNQRSSRGAYDNAVGVGAVIELARLFTQELDAPPPISMVFAAWDSEEGGGAGSRQYLGEPVWDAEIVGYINLDMFALNWPVRNTVPGATEEYFKLHVYTSPVRDFTIYDHVEYPAETLLNFSDFRDTVEDIAYCQLGYPSQWVIVEDDTAGVSDHRFFVERSIPAVWLRGLNERPREEGDLNEIAFKHTPADTLEVLERYAGGKQALLSGIDTGLVLACDLAVQWMEHVNATSTREVDEAAPDGAGGGVGVPGGAAIGLSLLVLLMIPVVFVLWRRCRGGS